LTDGHNRHSTLFSHHQLRWRSAARRAAWRRRRQWPRQSPARVGVVMITRSVSPRPSIEDSFS